MGFLKNNYKTLYEKPGEKPRVGYASKNLPWDETNSKVTLYADGDTSQEVKLSDYALVYEKDMVIRGSLDKLPSAEDVKISGLDEDGNVVFGETVTPAGPYTISISDESAEYISVSGTGEYSAGQAVEVIFTLHSHYTIEHVFADKPLSDLIVESGSDTSKWVKATFTMPNTDVVLTLSSDPELKLETEFPYDHTEGFGHYAAGTTNIMLRIYGLPPAGDTVHYNAVAVDSTGTERGLDLTCDYDDYFETMLTEMPDADVTVTVFNDA